MLFNLDFEKAYDRQTDWNETSLIKLQPNFNLQSLIKVIMDCSISSTSITILIKGGKLDPLTPLECATMLTNFAWRREKSVATRAKVYSSETVVLNSFSVILSNYLNTKYVSSNMKHFNKILYKYIEETVLKIEKREDGRKTFFEKLREVRGKPQ